jgi:hypothetical protein
MLALGESSSGWIWLALTAMMGDLFVVQPRPKAMLAAPGGTGIDSP